MSYTINVRYEGINDDNYGEYPPGSRGGQGFGWYGSIEEARSAAKDSLCAAGVSHVEIFRGTTQKGQRVEEVER
jgi:hypothetical protein